MITDSFDSKTKPIIGLKDFYGERQNIARTCLITFSKEIYELLLSSYHCEEAACISTANGGIPIYKFTYKEKEILFYLSCMGSSLASQCCIEANWLTGADKFIMFGSAGSLDSEKTTGKFVIPTHAYHYAPPTDYIEIKNHEKLEEIFALLNIPYVKGKAWTTDAILRETVGHYNKRKSEGCIAVEMELAGVQAVCDFHGFELYDFLATGDVLSEDSYCIDGLSDANHNPDKLYIALETALRV